MTHLLAPYHDLATVTAAFLAIFVFACWATRNEEEL